MLLGLLQIFGWIAVGYNIKAHNMWAVASYAFGVLFITLTQVIIKVIGELNNGDTSKSRRS